MKQEYAGRWRTIVISIVVSIGLLWLAFRELDWSAITQVAETARWIYLIPAFAIWSLGLLTRAIRWQILLGRQTSLPTTFHILNLGFALNNTIPFRVGDVVRAVLIGRNSQEVSTWTALSTVVVERILDMMVILGLFAMTIPIFNTTPTVVVGGATLGVATTLGIVVLLLLPKSTGRIHALLGTLPLVARLVARFNVYKYIDQLIAGLESLTSVRGVLKVVFWSIFSWLIWLLSLWLLTLMFPQIPQSSSTILALVLAIVGGALSFVVPFTIASLGPFEAAVIFALTSAGVSQEVAATYAVIWHMGAILVYAIWGVIALIVFGLSPETLANSLEDLEESSLGADKLPTDHAV